MPELSAGSTDQHADQSQMPNGLFDNPVVGVVQADAATGRLLRVNDTFCRLTGYGREELLRHTFFDLTRPEERDMTFSLTKSQQQPQGSVEQRLVRKDGKVAWVRVYATGCPVLPGQKAVIVEDLSALKRAEEELQVLSTQFEARIAKRTDQLYAVQEALTAEVQERRRGEQARSELLRRLIAAQEDERRRIARDLHDHMGQLSAAMILGLKNPEDLPPDSSSTRQGLRRLRELAAQIGKELHDLALELRPSALDDVGLVGALTSYTEAWSRRTRVDLEFQEAGLGSRIPRDVETVLYRVVQEALTNVLKHAQANRVSVVLEKQGRQVTAVVEDNGKGFHTNRILKSTEPHRRMGLLGMQERLATVGGVLVVESIPGKGTTVIARIVLDGVEEGSR